MNSTVKCRVINAVNFFKNVVMFFAASGNKLFDFHSQTLLFRREVFEADCRLLH